MEDMRPLSGGCERTFVPSLGCSQSMDYGKFILISPLGNTVLRLEERWRKGGPRQWGLLRSWASKPTFTAPALPVLKLGTNQHLTCSAVLIQEDPLFASTSSLSCCKAFPSAVDPTQSSIPYPCWHGTRDDIVCQVNFTR
jgi:hypothetical protein